MMKLKFGAALGDDGRPLYLSQQQIRSWFSRRAAKLKRAAVEAALAADAEEEDTGASADGNEDEDASDGDDDDDLNAMTVAVLKQCLRQRGLKVSGLKAELIDRLVEYEPAE